MSKGTLGPDHPGTLMRMANLGVNYRDAGRLKEAILLLEETLERARKRPDGFPASLVWVQGAMAQTYDQAGEFAKSETFWRQEVEKTRKRDGEASPPAAATLASLGLNLLRQKRYTDAESLLRDCLAIREEKLPDEWQTFNTKSLLGGSLMGQEKYAEAEPLLLAGYEGMKGREAKIPPQSKKYLSEALERVVQLYDGWGKKDQADEWRKKLDAHREAEKETGNAD